MSFLYDKKVYEQIIKSAQAKDPSIMAYQPDRKTILSAAKKLVNKLSRELSGSTESPNITSSKQISELKIPQINTLDSFLKYLAEDQIKINGLRICYGEKEFNQLTTKDDNIKGIITTHTSREPDSTRKLKPADYYVNIPALVEFVKYLDKQSENNPLFATHVNTIINQISKNIPGTNIAPEPKAKPGQPKELPSENILDLFLDKKFDASKSIDMSLNGRIALKAKDLKSKTSLNSWLQDDSDEVASVVIVDPNTNQKREATYGIDTAANACTIIQVLYQRAKYKLSVAKTDDESKNASYYKQKIEELVSQFYDPNEKACTLIPVSTTVDQKPSEKDKSKSITQVKYEKQVPGEKEISPKESQDITELMNEDILPFSFSEIDFDRITLFLNKLDNLIKSFGTVQSQNLMTLTDQARTSIGNTRLKLTRPTSVIPLRGGERIITGLIKPNEKPVLFINYLNDVLRKTLDVILQFQSIYGKRLEVPVPNSNQLLNKQRSLYTSNVQQLNHWESFFQK